jgi:hypothetical protein
MKIEFNQEELVEALLLLLANQGFKADTFQVNSFKFVAGRGENKDRVEVELSKKVEEVSKSTQPDLPFEPDNTSSRSSVGDIFK